MLRKKMLLLPLASLLLLCCGQSERNDALNRLRTEDSLQRIRDSLKNSLNDSLNNLLLRADSLSKKHAHDSALKLCDIVLTRDTTLAQAWLQKGIIYERRKKYAEGIDACSSALRLNRFSGQAWFQRAVCHARLNQKQEAVSDLQQAMKLQYPGADSLHEKINPLKKRISGSHCVCCDGTISHSSGRGTCSHHGGVCRVENEYESYREFK